MSISVCPVDQNPQKTEEKQLVEVPDPLTKIIEANKSEKGTLKNT